MPIFEVPIYLSVKKIVKVVSIRNSVPTQTIFFLLISIIKFKIPKVGLTIGIGIS